MPPAGPRGGASTSTPPSRADAMAASTVCLGCVKPTASPVLRREHSGVPVGGSGPRESRALDPRDRVLTRAARCARPRRTTADATLASTPASSRREPRPHVSGLSPSDLPDASPATSTTSRTATAALGRESARHRDEARALEARDHEASEHAGSNGLHGVAVWRPSTVAEHRELPAREEETANAPGRSEGRCEHLDPAVARRRDGRLDGLPRMREAHGQPRPTSRTLRCSGRRFRTEGVASTRTSRPRPYEGSHVRATHTHDGRRDTRLDARFVAARATTSRVGSLPLGPAGRFACDLDDFTHGDCGAGARVSASSRRGSRLGGAGSRSVGARRVEWTARSGRVAPEHRRRAPRAASS
jgi:hypothetical protein